MCVQFFFLSCVANWSKWKKQSLFPNRTKCYLMYILLLIRIIMVCLLECRTFKIKLLLWNHFYSTSIFNFVKTFFWHCVHFFSLPSLCNRLKHWLILCGSDETDEVNHTLPCDCEPLPKCHFPCCISFMLMKMNGTFLKEIHLHLISYKSNFNE